MRIKIKDIYTLITLLLVIFLVGCSKYSDEPQVKDGYPKNRDNGYLHSSVDVAQAGKKLFFISGEDSTLYYAEPYDNNWKIKNMEINNCMEIKASEPYMYILSREEQLSIFDTEKDQVITHINLSKAIPGRQRLFRLAAVDQSDVYIRANYTTDGSNYKDHTLFIKVTSAGEVTILKEIPGWEYATPSLVDGDILYYSWRDLEGNHKVISWNMETDQTTVLSTNSGMAIGEQGCQYRIWNDSLVFPVNNEGFCVAKLDGSGDYIIPCTTEYSYVIQDGYIYIANETMDILDLETQKIQSYDPDGDYAGTLTTYDDQFALLRYEMDQNGVMPDGKRIYFFSLKE